MSLRIGFKRKPSWPWRTASRTVKTRCNRPLRSSVQGTASAPRLTSLGRLPLRSLHGCLGHSDVFVRSAVIKKPTVSLTRHPFDKNNVGHLPYLFPFFFRREDRVAGAGEQLARIFAIEDGYARAVHEAVVGAVVDQHDSAAGKNRWRPRLNHSRIEFARSLRQARSLGLSRPVQQVGGIRNAHLIRFIGAGPQPIHPILAVDLFRNDGARLRPTPIPIAFVGRKDHTLAFPMDLVV